MISISHIRFGDLDSISKILDWTELVKASDFNIAVDDVVKSDTDVIVLGIGDGGFDITDKIDSLIEANNKGVGILFTHDFPHIVEYDSRYEELGISGIDNSYEYNMFKITKIVDEKHPILDIYYDLRSIPLTTQCTHNIGTILSKDCSIVLNNPNIEPSYTNYYLACLEREGKGRIAHMALGHNDYKSDSLLQLDKAECSIFTNTVLWLAGL